MKKIGVLFGMENTFPGALVERINSMELDDVRAEFVQVGDVRIAEPSGYAVIVDRISHDMPFYRAYLKSAVLTGTQVINNPFWWSADDKFFNYSLATKLGVAVPRTVLLPHKLLPAEMNQQSVRNLEFPLDWEAIFGYVKFPAFLKPHDGGGWRDVHHVHNADEFFRAYDSTRDLCMVLQAAVNYTEYYRCFVVGCEDVLVMPYDPRRPHTERYVLDAPECSKELLERLGKDALTLCRTLGYDLNTVEFAVEEGVPYAIDFMNPVPDADLHSVGKDSFEWIVDRVARLAVKKAGAGEAPSEQFHWSRFLAGGTAESRKSAAKKAVKKRAVRASAKK
ncbi:MAG TPA: hypothetical protein VIJ65_04130 [Acidobacteriaceae bacterium]